MVQESFSHISFTELVLSCPYNKYVNVIKLNDSWKNHKKNIGEEKREDIWRRRMTNAH